MYLGWIFSFMVFPLARDDGNPSAVVAGGLELDGPGDEREQRVVLADAVGAEHDLVDGHLLPGVARAAIDGDLAALFDPVALRTVPDDRVHGLTLPEQKKSPRGVRDVMKSIKDDDSGRPSFGRPSALP